MLFATRLGILMKTFSAKTNEVKHDWYLVDASNKILGRLATTVASHLRGKHKPQFTPHIDTGDFIIVINAEKIAVTGRKFKEKKYYHHSGYPGGLKTTTLQKLQEKDPTRIIELAVKGMLPKNSLGRKMYKKLKVYAGNKHPHEAQQPKQLTVEDRYDGSSARI